MSTSGVVDSLGRSHNNDYSKHDFQVPTRPLPPANCGGTTRDMGSLALFLVANEYVNGEWKHRASLNDGIVMIHGLTMRRRDGVDRRRGESSVRHKYSMY